MKPTDRAAARAWAVKARSKRCAVCGAARPQGHHIITQQMLRKQCFAFKLDFDRYRWDQRNLLPLCDRCHAAHHSRVAPVPLGLVLKHAPKFMQIAREVHVLWWISRQYPNGRLDAWRRRTAGS